MHKSMPLGGDKAARQPSSDTYDAETYKTTPSQPQLSSTMKSHSSQNTQLHRERPVLTITTLFSQSEKTTQIINNAIET